MEETLGTLDELPEMKNILSMVFTTFILINNLVIRGIGR